MSCIISLTDDLINDCSVKPLMGLKSGVIVNYDDVDWTGVTQTASIVSALPLKSGAAGFAVSWLKRMGSNSNTLAASPTEREGFTHSFACQLAGFSAENAERIAELEGGKFILVSESNYRGATGEDAFKIFGLDTGLHLTEAVHSSNENGGAITYVLSTLEGDLEGYIFNTYLETDYATSKASFDSLFASV